YQCISRRRGRGVNQGWANRGGGGRRALYRVKHCAGFPAAALRYCLGAAGITIAEVDHIGISRDPSAHLHKKVLFAAKRLSQIAVPASRTELAQASVHHRDTENTEDAQ